MRLREGDEVEAMRRLIAPLGLLIMLSGGVTIAATRAGSAAEVLGQIEAQARDLTAHGARSESVSVLQRALEMYGDTALRKQIEADIRLYSLEGQPAPHLQAGMSIGVRVPAAKELDGKVVLLFFWASWCPECKAESSIIAAVWEKYREHGLVLIAPTQRYGFVDEGRPAAPDQELRYIVHVRDTYYPFRRQVPTPVTDANYKQYGVNSLPMHVLIDRKGIIRLYQPGRITLEELTAAIQRFL
jgi:thiol-disulfide isomerase/thioredoxin